MRVRVREHPSPMSSSRQQRLADALLLRGVLETAPHWGSRSRRASASSEREVMRRCTGEDIGVASGILPIGVMVGNASAFAA